MATFVTMETKERMMASLRVVYFPDDPLTRVAQAFDAVTDDVAALAEDMLETMNAYEGVGLAGPQVGVAKRIIVVQEPKAAPMCLINPEILEMEGVEQGEEGCLSLPQVYAPVPRAAFIHVRALDHRGKRVEFEARDLLARIIQHECDHLDGLIFLDRVDVLTQQAKLREWNETREKLLLASTKA
ncbi:MAG TPA: peptide deformylase [Candidatus Hydrogenedentes bacterium]|nr:peptide deformylase [Candidatus Hydrogenedentota bacterium]